MKPYWIVLAALSGAIAVSIGAFGAHGAPGLLEEWGYDSQVVSKRMATLETGARYQMYCALAALAVGVAMLHSPRKSWAAACWLLLAGSAIFSGLLYALAFVGEDFRWLGAIVPIGGVMMIAGWVMIAVGAIGVDKARRADSA